MIDIDFDKAVAQAAGMAQCADGIMQQYNKLNSLIADIRRSWKGETADAYIRKLEEFATILESDAKKCRDAATNFRTKVNFIKQTEETAKSILAN